MTPKSSRSEGSNGVRVATMRPRSDSLRFIVQVWPQPLLYFAHRNSLPLRVVLYLIPFDLTDGKIAGLRVREVVARDRARRIHGEVLRKANTSGFSGVQEL